ncbi:MAG: hypothetical protein MZW92_70935 [Comamonadaceae bacterium]|nr:hypothetical protein [Comamonadaceae bacterium]
MGKPEFKKFRRSGEGPQRHREHRRQAWAGRIRDADRRDHPAGQVLCDGRHLRRGARGAGRQGRAAGRGDEPVHDPARDPRGAGQDHRLQDLQRAPRRPLQPVHVLDISSAGAAFFDMVISNVHLHLRPRRGRRAHGRGGALEHRHRRPGHDPGGRPQFSSRGSGLGPDDYGRVLDHLRDHGGATALEMRLELARKAFRLLSRNEAAIAEYLEGLDIGAVKAAYEEVK